jgi:hypothetical protein
MDEPQVGISADAFDALLVGEPPAAVAEAPVETPVETPAVEPKARDDKGRFAAKEKPAEPPAELPEPEVTDEAAPEAAKKAKPRDDPQARIDQVIARQREAERRAMEAAERADKAERELQALRAPKTEAAKPETFPNYQTYLQTNPNASLEDWLDARDEWRDTRRDAALSARAAEAKRLETFNQHFEKFTERVAGLDHDTLARIEPKLLYGPQAIPISALPPGQQPTFGNFLAEIVLKSEHPKDLLLHLSDRTIVQRLATLPPDDVIRELARFEARLEAADSGPVPMAKPSVSQAKKPIQPLGSSPQAPDPNEVDDDTPVEQWITKRNAHDLAVRRGR